MNIAIIHGAFFGSFRRFFPQDNVEVIQELKIDKLLNQDLIIFTGGEDVSPKMYGQKNENSFGCNDNRDKLERSILLALYDRNFPVYMYGSCRGHQIIAAALGGSLYQDIGVEKKVFHPGFHELEIVSSDIIIKHFKNGVNSMHHQSVKSIPFNGIITSLYKGIIESINYSFALTTQFHPELMGNTQGFFDELKTIALEYKKNGPQSKKVNNRYEKMKIDSPFTIRDNNRFTVATFTNNTNDIFTIPRTAPDEFTNDPDDINIEEEFNPDEEFIEDDPDEENDF